jgi:hypothetical protein
MRVLASVVIEAVHSISIITRNKIPTSWLNNSNFNSKHNMLKHSLLQHEEKGPKTLQDSNRKHHSTTTLQSGYFARKQASKADYSNHNESNTLGSQSFLLSWLGILVAHRSTTTRR